MSLLERLKSIGPGAMVAAAFIGPGTVVTATKSGGSFGYSLLWAVLLSTLGCLILQEMAARLGVVGQLGVGQALRQRTTQPVLKFLSISLVLGAILLGNTAYEAGNITGAALGMNVAIPAMSKMHPSPVVIGVTVLAMGLLWTGTYRYLEKFLVALVVVMGVVFILAAVLVKPDWGLVLKGVFAFEIPEDSWSMIAALIGTTVVPYNLFLHASSAQVKWSSHSQSGNESSTVANSLTDARVDSVLSIGLGGLITAAILIAAAGATMQSAPGSGASTVDGLAMSFRNVVGGAGPYLLCLGFLAAGLSSAITAPLAAAHASTEVLGWNCTMHDMKFRIVWLAILLIGGVFASLGFRPANLILFAQIANGLLLPIVATFLVVVMNDRKIMGDHVNGIGSNGLGMLMVGFTVYIGLRSIWRAGIVQLLIGETS